MDGATITAIGSLIIALTGLIVGVITNRSAATKAETDSLRETIDLLSRRNKELDEESQRERAENARLRNDVNALTMRVADLEQESEFKSSQMVDMQGEISRLTKENAELRVQLQAVVDENHRLKGSRRKASE